MDSHSYCSPQADHARHCVLPSASRMLVHRLFRLQQDALATHIDMTCRWVLPFILYPLITVASLVDRNHPEEEGKQAQPP